MIPHGFIWEKLGIRKHQKGVNGEMKATYFLFEGSKAFSSRVSFHLPFTLTTFRELSAFRELADCPKKCPRIGLVLEVEKIRIMNHIFLDVTYYD